MDDRTFETLKIIGSQIPKEMIIGAMKKEYVYKHEREGIERMLKDARISEKKKIRLRELLNDPKLLVEKDVIDFEKSKEIEKFVEDKVKFAIEAGIIKKPDEDDFIKKLKKNFDEHNPNDGSGQGSPQIP